ncbi:MAG TPA: caspase family protein [Pyrinomonadaceae bacterium]|nr:caspase family protein [Pyrinomonadaceae bacterium]
MPRAKARKGLSIHIGLDYVDPNHYDGWDGKLAACVFDARDMIKLAKSRKFKPTLLLNEQATSSNVTAAISGAASKLDTGDMLWISYSGHGGQVPDTNGDEKDGFDETWVLYDRQLVDDELYALWSQFAPGVRVLVTSDSCHSGSVVRKIIYDQLKNSPIASAAPAADPLAGTRAMPEDAQKRTYRKNKATYDGIQKTFRSGEKIAVNASILLMSGCQDNQLSSDGTRNGLFTQTMLKVWNGGKFSGRYAAFHKTILDQMPPWQSPNFMRVGVKDANFEAQTPFTI